MIGGAASAGGAQRAEGPRCVAFTQPRRGHGVSVTSYYLARALVDRGLRTLLVDLTGRPERTRALVERERVKNLAQWTAPSVRSDIAPALLDRVRQQTAGKVDVCVVDIDAPLLRAIGGLSAGLSYITILVEPGDSGLREAERLGSQLDDRPPPYGRVGVALCRTETTDPDALPQQTPGIGLPILGGFPADYLLAATDDYSLKSLEVRSPHEDYLVAMRRLARALAEIVPLSRVAGSSTARAAAPSETRRP